MRIGVVGLGYWGSKHVRVLSSLDQVDEVVGIEPRAARRAELGASFPTLRTADSLRAALGDIDAAIIATQPSTHTELGLELIGAGKHVLVEKPLAMSSCEAQVLIDAAERADRVLMVGHTFAYNPAVTALRDVVSRGELGDVLYLNAARLNLGLYQSDCNVIWDLAPHDVSIANLIVGASPTAVTAWGSDHINRGLVDNAYLRLDYGTANAQAVVHVSWLDPHKVRQLTVVGSRRMAVYDDLADEQRVRIYDKGVNPEDLPAAHSQPMTYRYGDIVAPYIPFEEPLLLQARHFLDCIRRDSVPRTCGQRGLEVVRVLEAAQRSLVEGRAVSLDDTAELRDVNHVVDLRDTARLVS